MQEATVLFPASDGGSLDCAGDHEGGNWDFVSEAKSGTC